MFGGFGGTGQYFALALVAEVAGICVYTLSGSTRGAAAGAGAQGGAEGEGEGLLAECGAGERRSGAGGGRGFDDGHVDHVERGEGGDGLGDERVRLLGSVAPSLDGVSSGVESMGHSP